LTLWQEAAVQAALLAVVHPGNTPHGYNLTFAFPMLMFIIIAGALFLRFRGAHNVPGHAAMRSGGVAEATAMTGESAEGATVEAAAGAAGEPGAGAAGETAGGQALPADDNTEEG
jgi:hypothetical protein